MTVVIVGTLDTKGREISYARYCLEREGASVQVIDAGVLGTPEVRPDTTASEVASAAGTTLEELRSRGDRGAAMAAMGEGTAAIVRDRHREGTLDGIFGLGGSGNTSVATTAMRSLPLGVPKLMVSTVAAGDVESYVGTTDVAMLHSVADVEGLNRVTRTVIANAAAAMAGMVSRETDPAVDSGPTVALTMFGVTTPCVQEARSALKDRGYETIVFHATGTGGQAMEELVATGAIDGVLDVTTTELADEYVGGRLGAGPDRLEAAGEAGIPQVVSVGALDMVNFGPEVTVPTRFEGRQFHAHNPEVTLMRTTPAECAEIGELMAEKLAGATGPTALAIPKKGVSMLDAPGETFHDPAADEALFNALRKNVRDVEIIDLDKHINDPAFSRAMVKTLHSYIRESADG